MLLETGIVEAVARFIQESGIPAVVDPVMVATSGATLLAPEAVESVKKRLIPRAALVTPNLDEASILLGRKRLRVGSEGKPRRWSWQRPMGFPSF
jgi:hydroxymethylpyrimidine/phosphomethylpyrimidine kinase